MFDTDHDNNDFTLSYNPPFSPTQSFPSTSFAAPQHYGAYGISSQTSGSSTLMAVNSA